MIVTEIAEWTTSPTCHFPSFAGNCRGI